MDRASMHELSLVRKLDSVQAACCSLFQATAPRKQPWQRFLLAFASIGSLMWLSCNYQMVCGVQVVSHMFLPASPDGHRPCLQPAQQQSTPKTCGIMWINQRERERVWMLKSTILTWHDMAISFAQHLPSSSIHYHPIGFLMKLHEIQ